MKTYEAYQMLIPEPTPVAAKVVFSGTKAGVTKYFDTRKEAMDYCRRYKNVRWAGVNNNAEIKAFHTKCEERREYIQAIIRHDMRKEYGDLTSAEFEACYGKALERTRKMSRFMLNMHDDVVLLRATKQAKKVQKSELRPIPNEVVEAANIVLKAAKLYQLNLAEA
jgi:hypothetical protein